VNIHNRIGGSKGAVSIMYWGDEGYRVTWNVAAGIFSVVHPDYGDAIRLFHEIAEEIR